MNRIDHAIRLDPERRTYKATNEGMHLTTWDWVSSTFDHSRPPNLYNPISQAIQRMVTGVNHPARIFPPLPPIR